MSFNLLDDLNEYFPPVSHRLRDAMGNRTDSSERVFAFESPTFKPGYDFRDFNSKKCNLGSRKFITSDAQSFWSWYRQRCPPWERHFYEIVAEDTPCRPYFDIFSIHILVLLSFFFRLGI
jgi:hypothetical protein